MSPGALETGTKVRARVFLNLLGGANCPIVQECSAFKHFNQQLAQYIQHLVANRGNTVTSPAGGQTSRLPTVANLTLLLRKHVQCQAKKSGWGAHQAVEGLPTVSLFRTMRIRNPMVAGHSHFVRAHPFPCAPFRKKEGHTRQVCSTLRREHHSASAPGCQ